MFAAPQAAQDAVAPVLEPEDFAPFSEALLRDLAAALSEAPQKRLGEVMRVHEAGAPLLERAGGDVAGAVALILAMWGEDAWVDDPLLANAA